MCGMAPATEGQDSVLVPAVYPVISGRLSVDCSAPESRGELVAIARSSGGSGRASFEEPSLSPRRPLIVARFSMNPTWHTTTMSHLRNAVFRGVLLAPRL